MIKNLYGLNSISHIEIEEIELTENFIDFSQKFSNEPGTIILQSGTSLNCARYHILAAKPWVKITGFNDLLILDYNNKKVKINENYFNFLRNILNFFTIDNMNTDLPITAGILGYFAYDLKNHIEKLPDSVKDKWKLPVLFLVIPSFIIVHDKINTKTFLCVPVKKDSGSQKIKNIKNYLKETSTRENTNGKINFCNKKIISDFTRNEYINSIKKIVNYIKNGDIYQVNMSQRFETDFTGSPSMLFREMYNSNPAPFFSFINAGNHQIISTSPERFILQNGSYIETRPIKGTRPRGKNANEDNLLKAELINCLKEDAELSMIVDLMRNDLGKICKPLSIKVDQHKKIEKYENVFHLISIIKGELEHKYNSIDIIEACFPGGSITGCPKIRAMEIIDEMEKYKRHIYTGAIGYISFHRSMDLSIAIRTGTVFNNKISFSVGGGIVYDSIPSLEYEETIHKGKTFFDLLN